MEQAPKASNAATAINHASTLSISDLVGARSTLLHGQSVDQNTQGVQALIKELGASTHMQRYLAQKIFDCVWQLNSYEIARRGIVANLMVQQLLGRKAEWGDTWEETVCAIFSGEWGNADVVRCLADNGYTPESLYAECVGLKQGPLCQLEQLTAVRTKTMLQLQASYEALVNRPILLERLSMHNELMSRDLKTIEVNAGRVSGSKRGTN